MRTALLLLFVAALAAVSGLLLFLAFDTATPGGPVTTAPAAESGADEARGAAELRGDGLAGQRVPGDRAADGGSGEPVRAAVQDGPELAGRVALPHGLAAPTEGLVVAAFEADLRRGQLQERLRRLVLTGDDEGVLAHARVEPDGRFRLRAPEGPAQLAALGTFVRTPRPTPVEGGESSIVLLGEAGATLEVEVGAPGVEPAELAGLELKLTLDFRSGLRLEQAFDFDALEAEVGADGRARFLAAPLGQRLLLVGEPEAFAPFERPVDALAPGERRVARVALAGGGSVEGVVLDARTGAPVEDARVQVRRRTPWGPQGESVRDTRTDAAGRFRLASVPTSEVVGLARADGYLVDTFELEGLHEGGTLGPVTVRLDRGTGVTGVVRWPDGEPVEGAEVDVRLDFSTAGMNAMSAWRGIDSEADTDADGRFAVTGLAAGPFVVRASKEVEVPGGAPADGEDLDRAPAVEREWTAVLRGVAEDAEVELVLSAPGVLAGRVVDAEGAPVTTFAVQATQRSSDLPWMPPDEQRWEDFEDVPDGAFEVVGLGPGDWEVLVDADGFASSEPRTVTLPTDERLEVELLRGGSIAGRVVAPNGAPVRGARVGEFVPMLQRVSLGERELASAITDEEGRFLLADAGVGEIQVFASHPDHASSAALTVDVAPSAAVEDVELVLRRGARLTGEVYGEDGELAGGMQIFVQSTLDFTPTMARTDDRGWFEVERLNPGEYQVVAMQGGLPGVGGGTDEGDEAPGMADLLSGMKMAAVALEDGAEEHVVLGAPPEQPIVVAGRVVSAGEPVGEGLVSLIAEGRGFDSLVITSLDAGGGFEAQVDGSGRYTITVQLHLGGPGSMEQSSLEFIEHVPAVERHELVLELPSGAITGRVVDADGKPLAGAYVSWSREEGVLYGSPWGGGVGMTSTDADGRYELGNLEAGTYQVAAGGGSMATGLGVTGPGGRTVHSGVVVQEGRATERVDFELLEPGTLAGRVLGTDGRPVPDVTVFVRDAGGALVDRFSMVRADSSGRFRYPGLAPGRYSVSARLRRTNDGPPLASLDGPMVVVRTGETTQTTLTVDAGVMLYVKVEKDGEPNVRARVTALDEDGRDVSGMIDMGSLMQDFARGFDLQEYRIGPLPPGRYRVTAVDPSGEVARKSLELKAGQEERRLRLRLRD